MNYLNLISKTLTITLHPQARAEVEGQISQPGFDWDNYIRLASDHFVVLSLYCRLRDAGLLRYMSAGLADHLRQLWQMNIDRNSEILRQAQRINHLLAGAGITPIYLKGVANLMDGLYPDPGERIVGDIDFLVPPHQYEQAAALLLEDGYYAYDENHAKPEPLTKHYPRLTHRTEIADVEVHFATVDPQYRHLFTYEMLAPRVQHPDGYSHCLTLHDTDKMTLAYMHVHLNDRGYITRSHLMRPLFDSLLIARRIDVAAWLCTAPLQQRAMHYSGLLAHLFGGAYPADIPRAARRFLFQYRFRQRYPRLSVVYSGLRQTLARMFYCYFLLFIYSIYKPHYRQLLFARLSNPRALLREHFRWYLRYWR